MAKNENLSTAKAERNDEFYTRLVDIENELRYYRRHFKGKTVLCNCDDPFESQFFKYFVMNFARLQLKKLIATCYKSSLIKGTLFDFCDVDRNVPKETPYKAVITSVYDVNGDGYLDMEDIRELFKTGENELTELKGDGDFRSEECLELLDEADVIVTNPPFSLFREYITTLINHKKKFVVIGPLSGVTYKSTFPLLRDGVIWFGATTPKIFDVPPGANIDKNSRKNIYVLDDGSVIAKFGNVYWYTNLDLKKRHEDLILVKRYNPSEYSHYTNFNGIEINDITEIPCDWDGFIGVPPSFLVQHNFEQFEIVGFGKGNLAKEIGVTKNHRGRTDLEIELPNGKYLCPFGRLVIRNKHPEPRKQS